MSTTPRLVPLRRMTLVEQPPVDQPAHRDPLHSAVQAACAATTFNRSHPPLEHTASAAMAFDAEEPRQKPKGSPLRKAINGAYWQGVRTGGFFVAAVATAAVASFLFGLKG